MSATRAEDRSAYALGLDFSTRAVKTVVLDIKAAEVVYTGTIDYDTSLPHYGTRGGVLPADEPTIRHTSPFMLIEALDLAFNELNSSGLDLGRIGVVKVDAMQHCTVYTDASFGKRLAHLDSTQPLLPQLRTSITRETLPIWEDRSPVREVECLQNTLQKHGSIQVLTGNAAELRFPAAQIMKWASQSPHDYSRTAHIFLLSAFLTSILAGELVPVDTGDGWGTNLNTLDIDRPGWNEIVLKAMDAYFCDQAAGLSLRYKLGDMMPYDTPLRNISPYFVQRHGVYPEAIVLAGTGDNPATLLGCGGSTVISLGSSYTVNGVMDEIAPSSDGEYNIFGYTPGRAMALAVFTNGAKVHEFFLDKYISGGADSGGLKGYWDEYVSAAGESTLIEDERLMLPYLMDESVPLRRMGIVRDGFDETDAEVNIRALHISQAISLRLHSSHLSGADTICVVGGGAGNRFLRQMIADAFDAATCTIQHADFAAPFGCCVSGARLLMNTTYEEAAERCVRVDEASFLHPLGKNRSPIRTLLRRYEALEKATGVQ
jgi:xylulokinase